MPDLSVSFEGATTARFRLDGQVASTTRRVVHGRTTYHLKVGKGSRTLLIEAFGRALTITLKPRRRYPELLTAQTHSAAGEFEKAVAALTPPAESKDPELRARALSARGRAQLRAGRFEAAIGTLRNSQLAAEAAGLRAMAVKELFTLAHTQMQELSDLLGAEKTLDQVRPALANQFGALAYHRAALALLRGAPRAALDLAREAARIGEQLDDARHYQGAVEMELMVLAELGRLADARALAAKVEVSGWIDPCADALFKTNLGWIEIVTANGDAARAKQKSEEAVHLYRTTCPEAFLHQNALINLALAEFRLHDPLASRKHLEEAAALGPLAGWVRAWATELEGRLLLAAGDARAALATFQDLRARTEIAAPVSSRYRAAVGVGLSFKQLRELPRAVDAFLDAEAELDREARLIPLAEGRDVFVGEREESSRELIDTLLTLGRPEDALRVARHARARALRTLNMSAQAEALSADQRTRWLTAIGHYQAARKKLEQSQRTAWEVPAAQREAFLMSQQEQRRAAERALDEAYDLFAASADYPLSAPEPDELLLAFYPLRTGWVAFAATAQEVTAKRVPRIDTGNRADLSEHLLRPFARQLDAAERVRILPYGSLKQVAFHALPYNGGVLFDYKDVAYGTDLGQPAPRRDFKVETAIIADPRTDLPFARDEVPLVVHGLGVPQAAQWLGARATREATLHVLSTTRFVHYAGHAEADPRGTHSRLLLANEGDLDAGDLLTLETVPHTVILSGCETMREPSDSPVASLGLAQALLARGTQLVIATTSRVPDAFGVALAKRLYAESGVPPDRARFRAALLSARQAGDASWESYRALVP